jgi:hypothetical protein
MKKLAAFLAVFLFTAPALAIDPGDLIATEATAVTLSTSSATSSDTIGSRGAVLRMNCTVDCWVAVMTTDTAAALAVSPYTFLPADETMYQKSPGLRYVIGIAGGGGTLHITEMSP